MKPPLAILFTICALPAIAQVQDPRSIPVSGAVASDEIAFSTIELGKGNAFPKGGVFVMRSDAKWQKYLKQIQDTDRHSKVDWKTQQLIAVHLESSASAANGFMIKRLHQTKGEVDIEIVLNKPPTSNGDQSPRTVTQAVAPFEIIATPIFNLPIKTMIVDG